MTRLRKFSVRLGLIVLCVSMSVGPVTADETAPVEISAGDKTVLLDTERQTSDTYTLLSKQVPLDDPAAYAWLVKNAKLLTPFFLSQLAQRQFVRDKNSAAKWYALSEIRARHDAYRCKERTVGVLLSHLGSSHKRLRTYFAFHTEPLIDGLTEALKLERNWLRETPDTLLCTLGLAEVEPSRDAARDKTSRTHPRSKWETIRNAVRASLERQLTALKRLDPDDLPLEPNVTTLARFKSTWWTEFFWLDNEQLIYLVSKQYNRARGRNVFAYGSWTEMSGPQDYPTEEREICAADGFQTTIIERGNTAVKFLHGKPPDLKPDSIASVKTLHLNPFDCKFTTAPRRGSWQLPLRSDHGVVIGQYKPDRIFLQKDGAPVADLALERGSSLHYCMAYAPARSLYYLLECQPSAEELAVFKEHNCVPLWTLSPAGETTKHCLPANSLTTSRKVSIASTRRGPVIGLRGRDLTKSNILFNRKAYGGAYLFEGGKFMKLIGGMVGNMSASPDGCKLAATVGTFGKGVTTNIISIC